MRNDGTFGWIEELRERCQGFYSDKRLVPVLGIVSILFFIGVLTLRVAGVNQTEMLLTKLTIEEIDFVENLELVENFEMLEQLDLLESFDSLEELTFKAAQRNKNV